MSKFVSILGFLLVLCLLQVSVLPTWPAPVNQLNLVLCVCIFITTLIGHRFGLWWAFGAGVLLELYANTPYGVSLLSYIATIIVINLLFTNVFTNRSLYALALLGEIATIAFALFTSAFTLLATRIAPLPMISMTGQSSIEFSTVLWQLLLHPLILVSLFFVLQRFSHRLHRTTTISGSLGTQYHRL